MLNLQQIERFIEANQYAQLIERILANGRDVDTSMRSALLQPAIVAPVALGLALQRASELSYGATDVIERIVARLLDLQHADGRFGSDRFTPRATDDAIVATAIALRGLLDYQQQHAFFRPLSPGKRAGVRVPPAMNHIGARSRPIPSSVLSPQHSDQGLAAAVERTVGALAAAVAEHAARAERDDSMRSTLPLDVARFQLQQHRKIAARINIPPAIPSRSPRRSNRSSCQSSWTQGMAA